MARSIAAAQPGSVKVTSTKPRPLRSSTATMPPPGGSARSAVSAAMVKDSVSCRLPMPPAVTAPPANVTSTVPAVNVPAR